MSSPPPVFGKRRSNTASEFLNATFAVTAHGTWDQVRVMGDTTGCRLTRFELYQAIHRYLRQATHRDRGRQIEVFKLLHACILPHHLHLQRCIPEEGHAAHVQPAGDQGLWMPGQEGRPSEAQGLQKVWKC